MGVAQGARDARDAGMTSLLCSGEVSTGMELAGRWEEEKEEAEKLRAG